MKLSPPHGTGRLVLTLIAQSPFSQLLGNTPKWNAEGAEKSESIKNSALIPLSRAHYLPESTGKKAARLGQLIEAGYDVPDGFVVTGEILDRTPTQSDAALLNSAEVQVLNRLWKKLQTTRVAVRSSGANDGGKDSILAGVHEPVLDISRDSLVCTIRSVYQTLGSDRTAADSRHTGVQQAGAKSEPGAVIVQKMVRAEFAGVMFTEHPETTGAVLIEMVGGPGEKLVSGNITPKSYAFGKLTGEMLVDESVVDAAAKVALEPLLTLGHELEAMFEQPQTIEWAYARGRFYLLQSQNINQSIASGASAKNLAENERRKLLQNLLGRRRRIRKRQQLDPAEAVYVQNELSNLLPRPTPLSADLIQRLWSAGGSTDLASQNLNIPYTVNHRSAPLFITIFGWMYVNKHEEKRRLGKTPGVMISLRLAREADRIQAHFKDEFLSRFKSTMIERNAIAMERLSVEAAAELSGKWLQRFVKDTWFVAERINICAENYMKSALDKLRSAGLEPDKYLNENEDTVFSDTISSRVSEPVNAEEIDKFLQSFGHRAPLDFELAEPRFAEDMNLVRQYIERSKQGSTRIEAEPLTALNENTTLQMSVKRARDFMRLKEEIRHHCFIELAQIRKLLVAIDNKLQLDGRVFQLTINEVTELANPDAHPQLMRTADQRFEAAMAWKSLKLPASLSVHDVERIDMLTGLLPELLPDVVDHGDLVGKRVAGDHEVTGKIRIITDIDQIHTFKRGEILVARTTDPAWHALFAHARGIITEKGGWSSHATTVARNYELPAIIGVDGICNRLQTGDVVRMTLAGSVDMLSNRRESDTTSRSHRSVAASDTQKLPVNGGNPEQNGLYHLSARKLFSYSRSMDRRAMKLRIADRRSMPRFNEHGEMQVDRRLANRLENVEILRKAG